MNGVIAGGVGWGLSSNYNYSEYNQFVVPVDGWLAGNSTAGTFTKSNPLPYTHVRNGAASENYDNIIYNNLWLKPTEFQFGMILQDKVYDIYIWNTYSNTINFMDLTYNQNLGYNIMVGTLPQSYQPTEEKNYALNLYKNGTSILNDTAIFTFDDGDSPTLEVSGKRILIVPDFCTGGEVKIPYAFINVKSVTLKQLEERRNVIDKIGRKISFSVMLKKDNAYLENVIRYGQEKMFGAPYLIEPMHSTDTGDLEGYQTINIQEDISKYFNLQNTDMIGLWNKSANTFEVAEISTLDTAGKQIVVTTPIVESFPVADTIIFPVMTAYLEDYNVTQKTMDIVKYSLTFREIV